MRFFIIATFSLASVALAQNCGPQYQNQVCDAGKCCSQHGWCDTTPDHCNPENCLKDFSGSGSSCSAPTSTFITKTSPPTSAPAATVFPAAVPEIDVCGAAQGGVTCPGAGANGYFYRCCSSAGHCGPKNDIQDEAIYCGDGCQAGFGKCNSEPKPPQPTEGAGVSGEGGECGPIVNKKCGDGLCCSGSNFCGKSEDFCGAANWCQPNWGNCS
ncbi:carbohydrate-binding module family 18 protein [Periconia macrospinosa]|uniref:Carbohydrate-binding module family 18 protein n=1 Tax=Periconia macrospinosa TaxID=97972 RepID=A0A2V1E8Q8_9PLEO|nr:carbohydrate-binding module family 18 protein [Periconia macrospinosa]